MISATSRRLAFGLGGADSRTARPSSSATTMLSRNGEIASVPGFNGRNARSVLAPMRTEATPASVSSKAMAGGGSRQMFEMESSSAILPFYERDLVDFLQRADAFPHL